MMVSESGTAAYRREVLLMPSLPMLMLERVTVSVKDNLVFVRRHMYLR